MKRAGQHPFLKKHRAYSRLAVKFAGTSQGRAYENIAKNALRQYHAMKARKG